MAAAIAIMDSGGMSALSMRKLGADLNVEAMSLYRHFPSKAELLTAARSALFDRLSDVGSEQSDGFERMRAVMRATYRLVEDHPSFVDLLFSGPLDAPTLRQRDADLAALEAMGLTPDDAAFGLQALISFVVGFLSGGGLTAPGTNEESFDFGLDLILDGLRRRTLV